MYSDKNWRLKKTGFQYKIIHKAQYNTVKQWQSVYKRL